MPRPPIPENDSTEKYKKCIWGIHLEFMPGTDITIAAAAMYHMHGEYKGRADISGTFNGTRITMTDAEIHERKKPS